MTEIALLTSDHPVWEQVAAFAETCSWRAGPVLAEKMRRREFQDWERVCAVLTDGKPVAFSTFQEKDELPEKYGFSPFIGFVFVDEAHRGQRLSGAMIEKMIAYALTLSYDKIYIMSGECGLYEKYGFRKIGGYETIYGTIDQLFVKSI